MKRTDSREKVTIPRALPFVTFLGDAIDPPTITRNDTASVIGKNGVPLKTFRSATVGVNANYFVATNIKFEVTKSLAFSFNQFTSTLDKHVRTGPSVHI